MFEPLGLSRVPSGRIWLRLRPFRLAVLVILIATAIPVDLRAPLFRWAFLKVKPSDLLTNTLLYLPLGLCLATHSLRAVAFRAACLSVLAEIIQIFSAYRYPGPIDVLFNTAGAVCGAVISKRMRWSARPFELGLRAGSGAMSAAFLVLLAFPLLRSHFLRWYNVVQFVELGSATLIGFLIAVGLLSLFQPVSSVARWCLAGFGGAVGGILLLAITTPVEFQLWFLSLSLTGGLGVAWANCLDDSGEIGFRA